MSDNGSRADDPPGVSNPRSAGRDEGFRRRDFIPVDDLDVAATADVDAFPIGDDASCLLVFGDPSLVVSELRVWTCSSLLAGRRLLIVDLRLADPVRAALVAELLRTNDRLAARDGALAIVSDDPRVRRYIAGGSAYQPPDTVPTMDQAFSALGVDNGAKRGARRESAGIA